MDFQPTEDQKALREGLRQFCDGQVPVDRLAELAKAGGFDRALWGEVAEMGIFGLRLPEDEGGVGLGNADAVIAFCELGRRLVPGPLAWTHLAAGLIDGAESGDCVVGGLDLIGENDPILIEHYEHIDALMVLRPEGVFRIDPKRLEAAPVEVSFDPLTPVHALTGVLPEGDRIADADTAAKLRLEGATLVSGQMLGICESTLEMANAYALSREQFGRPIGGFQAVKHMLADMFVKQEVARAAAYAAGATLDAPEVGDVVRAVASAKVCAGEGALRNSRTCIQIHGGMGYTWEIPAHYYLKRTWVLENVFGTTDEHSLVTADRLDEFVEA